MNKMTSTTICDAEMTDFELYTRRDLTKQFRGLDDSGLGSEFEEMETDIEGLSPLETEEGTLFHDSDQMINQPQQTGDKKPKSFDDVKCFENDVDARELRTAEKKLNATNYLLMSKMQTDDTDHVRTTVDRLVEEELIGDGSSPYCLPTIPGKHQDLKSITPETMADILTGRYDDVIGSYRVIDCRYPYEYEGGHIRGADNLYTHEQVSHLLHKPANQNGKRDILIFHCEFSLERGPKMSRFLRAQDRASHQYPTLTYPEVYLLDGGYKAFFEKNNNKSLCQPMAYKPMLHQEHSSDLRHFRTRSKSWTAGEKKRNAMRLLF